jgi:hypothetical protein
VNSLRYEFGGANWSLIRSSRCEYSRSCGCGHIPPRRSMGMRVAGVPLRRTHGKWDQSRTLHGSASHSTASLSTVLPLSAFKPKRRSTGGLLQPTTQLRKGGYVEVSLVCAEARGRTGTPVKAADFESAASANSATSAIRRAAQYSGNRACHLGSFRKFTGVGQPALRLRHGGAKLRRSR